MVRSPTVQQKSAGLRPHALVVRGYPLVTRHMSSI
jgi:hypothetical protein